MRVSDSPPGQMRRAVEGLWSCRGPGDEGVAGGQEAVPTGLREGELQEEEVVLKLGRIPWASPGTRGDQEAVHPEEEDLQTLSQPCVSTCSWAPLRSSAELRRMSTKSTDSLIHHLVKLFAQRHTCLEGYI